MKKILSILVSVTLLASACSLFFTAAAEDTDTNTFKAQHLDIDFSNYTLTENNIHQFSGYNQWLIDEEESGNKYLSYELDAAKTTGVINIGQSSFVLNADGYYGWNPKTERFLKLAQDGVYKLSLKYRLKTDDNTDNISLKMFAYKNSQNLNHSKMDTRKVLTIIESSQKVSNDNARAILSKSDSWNTASVIFTANDLDTTWNNYLAVQLVSTNTTIKGNITCDIDDIQVDRLAAVKVNGVPSYKIAPPCDYSKYLFSGTGNFAGDTDISNIINGKVEVYGDGATAEVTKEGELYSDSACNNVIKNAAGLFATTCDNGVYNCYQKIDTKISNDQFAFVGFDIEPKRRSGEFTGSAFVNSWNDNSGFSIVNNEAYTGNSSLIFEKNNTDGSQKLYIGNGYEYEVGKGYKISFYTKRVYKNTTSYEISAFAGNGFDEKEQGGTKSVTVTPSEDWTKYEIIYYLGDDVDLDNPNKYYAPGLKLSDDASSLYIDAITISKYEKTGDVNGDEKIDICDLVGINEYIESKGSYRMIEDNAKLLNSSGTEINDGTLGALRTKLLG